MATTPTDGASMTSLTASTPLPPGPRDDGLHDFEPRTYTFDDVAKTVHVAGSGPAVVILPEMPGISPDVVRFARWVRDAGFRVFLPSLFGRDGAYPDAENGLAVLRRACVSAEFGALGAGSPAPVTSWLRQLASAAHAECGGPGVGAIGMCFTGNFALSMVLDASVIAPVLCQPSLPLDDADAVALSTDELCDVADRMTRDDLTAIAFRFAGDTYCTAARFAAYRRALGGRFQSTVLPDSAANPDPTEFFAEVVGCPHSVVTAHLVDEAGHPTIAARDAIIDFLHQRLDRSDLP